MGLQKRVIKPWLPAAGVGGVGHSGLLPLVAFEFFQDRHHTPSFTQAIQDSQTGQDGSAYGSSAQMPKSYPQCGHTRAFRQGSSPQNRHIQVASHTASTML